MTGITYQSFVAVLIVLGLVAALAWLVRRGAFNSLRRGPRAITVETAVPLGERRSLVIVSVEGRRILLGLTPGQISMVTELGSASARNASYGETSPKLGEGGPGQSFENRLDAARA